MRCKMESKLSLENLVESRNSCSKDTSQLGRVKPRSLNHIYADSFVLLSCYLILHEENAY